jgi:xylan 1,4-beta-xylosidase
VVGDGDGDGEELMTTIHNPVLPGFHPDPSFVRVGDDYYLATSTFEWFPGVPIHHSRDLKNWRLIGHALTETRVLDLRGVPDSSGIWAPSLSFENDTFYLVYTIVRQFGFRRPFKDHHNYLVTSKDILGPWSDPIYLNASGFDASLFHDDDGRKYVTQIQWDFRDNKPRFGGIILQEYSHQEKKLVGPLKTILRKDVLIEGPNLYKRDGWYYLMLAEGGTGSNHGISMARSKTIQGPYELDPQHSVLTARDDQTIELQQSGHGELVQTQAGAWYLAHLCTRPVGEHRRNILGRETALQKVVWQGGWLRLESGGTRPQVEVPAPRELESHQWPPVPARDEFDEETLSPQWSTLRVPLDESWASLKARTGWLRLRGRESMHSLFEQSLVVKRLQSTRACIETCLQFAPTHFTQMAGLIGYFDTRNHIYLRVTHYEEKGKVLGLTRTDDGAYQEFTDSEIEVGDWPLIFLRAEIDGEELKLSASPDGENWQGIGPMLDMTHLSDSYGGALQFTGTMVGICAQDLNGMRAVADFDYFELNYSA